MKPKLYSTWILIASFFVAAILLSACTINIGTTIAEDGSGTWRTEFIFNTADKENLKSFDTTVEQFCNDMNEDNDEMPAGATVVIEEHGEESWCVMTVPFASLEDLRAFYEEGDGIVVNRLEIIDSKLYYDIDVDMSDQDTSSMGSFPIELNWKLTVPGRIGTNNATSVEGNTLTWKLDQSQIAKIQAESSLSAIPMLPWFPDWSVVAIAVACSCLCVVAVVIIVVVVVMLRKRK